MRATVDLPAALIVTVGEALYGEHWQAPLGRDLGIEERTMRRWAQAARAGKVIRFRRGLLADARALLEDRPAVIMGALQRVLAALAETAEAA